VHGMFCVLRADDMVLTLMFVLTYMYTGRIITESGDRRLGLASLLQVLETTVK
jgi:hypothetical protein